MESQLLGVREKEDEAKSVFKTDPNRTLGTGIELRPFPSSRPPAKLQNDLTPKIIRKVLSYPYPKQNLAKSHQMRATDECPAPQHSQWHVISCHRS